MDSKFLTFINSIVLIPEVQREKFCSLLTVKHFAKGEYFVREGQYPKTIGFVNKGLFRYFYVSGRGEEFTKGFFVENTILSSYSAIIQKRVSYFAIQALEDATIETIDYIKFLKLFEEDPCWNQFLITTIEKAFIIKEEREREFLLFDAQERYKSFLQRFPRLESRVNQHIIASYIGITPESLSRVRKKMGLLT